MQRTGRRVAGFLTVLSLCVCLAVTALWARSHAARDWVRFHRVARVGPPRVDRGEVLTHPGVLLLTKYTVDYRDDTPGLRQRLARHDGVYWESLPLRPWLPPDPGRRSQRLGFLYRQTRTLSATATTATTVAVPCWALLVPTAVAPALWLVRRLRRRRRTVRGLCAACGYDLRASPERCPECGEPVAA